MPFTSRFPSFFVPQDNIRESQFLSPFCFRFSFFHLKGEKKGEGIIVYDSIISISRVYPTCLCRCVMLPRRQGKLPVVVHSATVARHPCRAAFKDTKTQALALGTSPPRRFPVVDDDPSSPTPVTISHLPVVSLVRRWRI